MESSHLGWLERGIHGVGGREVGEVSLKITQVEQNQVHELESDGRTANVSGLVRDQLQTHQVRKEAQWIHLEMRPRMNPVWSALPDGPGSRVERIEDADQELRDRVHNSVFLVNVPPRKLCPAPPLNISNGSQGPGRT
jgi:hypothetical protein